MCVCVSKPDIDSDNGLPPVWRQPIIRTNAGLLSVGSLETNISEVLIEIEIFSLTKMYFKLSAVKVSLGPMSVLIQSFNIMFIHHPSFIFFKPYVYSIIFIGPSAHKKKLFERHIQIYWHPLCKFILRCTIDDNIWLFNTCLKCDYIVQVICIMQQPWFSQNSPVSALEGLRIIGVWFTYVFIS